MSARDEDMVRLTELATLDLLDALQPPEAAEYAHLRARHPDFDVDSLEHAAAALHLAAGVVPQPLPDSVYARLMVGADDFFAGGDAASTGGGPSRSPKRWAGRAGWLAAAAGLLLGVLLWSDRPRPVTSARQQASLAAPRASVHPEPSPAAPPASAAASGDATGPTSIAAPSPAATAPSVAASVAPPDAAAERDRFLRDHRYLWQRSWQRGSDPTGELVTGDVVWDAQSQTGFMRFRGLRRNDPNVEQYQLWIFDARRDARYPVDGGVFDAQNANGGDVVAFRAHLGVEVPLMFVVTVERRGGVVVSDRARVAAVATSG